MKDDLPDSVTTVRSYDECDGEDGAEFWGLSPVRRAAQLVFAPETLRQPAAGRCAARLRRGLGGGQYHAEKWEIA